MPFDPRAPGVRLLFNDPRSYSNEQLAAFVKHIQSSWLSTSPVEKVFMLKIPPGVTVQWKSGKSTVPVPPNARAATATVTTTNAKAKVPASTSVKASNVAIASTNGQVKSKSAKVKATTATATKSKPTPSTKRPRRAGKGRAASDEDSEEEVWEEGMDWDASDGKEEKKAHSDSSDEDSNGDEEPRFESSLGLLPIEWSFTHPSMMEDAWINNLSPDYVPLTVSTR